MDDLDWALGHMKTKARMKSNKGLDKIRAAEKKLSEQEGVCMPLLISSARNAHVWF